MGRIPRQALLAADSPRVLASNHRCGPGTFTMDLARNGAPTEFSIRFPEDFGLDGFSELLPWPLIRAIRPGHRFYIGLWATLAGLIPTILLLPVFCWPLPAMASALLIWREARSKPRRSRRILDNLQAELAEGVPLAELRCELDEALRLDSTGEAARFLLACCLLELGEDASVLLQLAVLRDHHPDAGAIVLLAAAAYLNLERPNDTLRMLDALEIHDEHPCFHAASRMWEEAEVRLGHQKRREPPLWGGPIIEGLLRHP